MGYMGFRTTSCSLALMLLCILTYLLTMWDGFMALCIWWMGYMGWLYTYGGHKGYMGFLTTLCSLALMLLCILT